MKYLSGADPALDKLTPIDEVEVVFVLGMLLAGGKLADVSSQVSLFSDTMLVNEARIIF